MVFLLRELVMGGLLAQASRSVGDLLDVAQVVERPTFLNVKVEAV